MTSQDKLVAKIKVLIVEDDRLIAENSSMMLRSQGYEVSDICNSSERALDSIRKNPPDIVLVDILLKGEQDGINFADRLRQDFDIPFVYVTATSDENILERAKVTSPYGYIIKPFNDRDLHSNIEMALYKFHSETRLELLNEMLYALNDISRHSEDALDEDSYLNLLCDTLVRGPSFYYVWAGLLGSDQKIHLKAHRNKGVAQQDLSPLKNDQTLQDCVRAALNRPDSTHTAIIYDSCGDCKLGQAFPGKPIVSVGIAFGNDVYGVLSAVVLPRTSSNAEFLRLFSELANKVGSSLHAFASNKQFGKAKTDLARSEQRFNRFTEIAQDIIVVHDTAGIINYVNPSTAALLDIPSSEIINQQLEQFVAKRSLPELDERKKLRSKGELGTLQYEMHVLAHSGEEIPIEVSSNPMLENEKITNYLLIGRDMRQRKEQDAQLKKLSRVVEQSPAAIIITDSRGLVTYVNPTFTTMTGFTLEDILGEFPTFLGTDNSIADISTDIQTTTKNGVWTGELETFRANHEKFWVNATVSALTDEDGNHSYIVIIEDISDKKQAALDLQRSKQSFEDIFNSTSDSIFVVDQNGKIISVNHGATLLYDYPEDYFSGKTIADLSAPGYNDLDEVKRLLNLAYAGEPQRYEFWGERRDGTAFPKEVQVNRVQYFGREVLLATARDISDRKRFEAELQEAVKKAEEADEVKGFFLANMSHEIRTPLTSIVGYIDLIFARIRGHLSVQDIEYFDIIRRNSDRLTRAVHSIIDLSQIEAGATQLESTSVNLTILIENIYIDHKVAADNKDIQFTYHTPSQAFWISGDKGLLQTAITNLVDNAINYTNQGQVEIFLISDGDNSCLLEIRDTGIGIAENSLQSIFGSFNQESMGYTKDYQGLGLGLTLSKKNFELHNLKIEVESEKGIGSSFFVRFPIHTQDIEPEIPEPDDRDFVEVSETSSEESDSIDQSDPASENAQQQVLIVEDDENAQKLFGLFLKQSYRIHFAATVKAGRECLETQAIDLVVTDLSLVGGEDGLALVKWVREHPRLNKIPVIALTAHAFIADRDRCLEAGCNDFITKPVFRSQLIEIIEKNIST